MHYEVVLQVNALYGDFRIVLVCSPLGTESQAISYKPKFNDKNSASKTVLSAEGQPFSHSNLSVQADSSKIVLQCSTLELWNFFINHHDK